MLSELALRLHTARQQRTEIARLTADAPDLTLADAYQIAALGIELRQRDGERVAALKMGLTSEGKRRQMNLDAPVYGVLTDRMAITADNPLRLCEAIHCKVEPEVAFRLRAPLRAGMTREQALDACDGVAAALEVLDSRYVGFKYFSLPDVVADNASSFRYAVGQFVSPRTDVTAAAMQMLVDGAAVAEGNSREISGDPVLSLVQLGDLAAQYGLQVPAGAVILSGAATAAFALTEPCEVALRVAGLPELRMMVVG